MTPKEKAKELIEKMKDSGEYYVGDIVAKQCALICVEEMIGVYKTESGKEFDLSAAFKKVDGEFGRRYFEVGGSVKIDYYNNKIEYWQSVKTEIEKL